MIYSKKILIWISSGFLCLTPVKGFTQNPENEIAGPKAGLNHSRLWFVTGSHLVAYSGTLIVLDQLWYKNYPRSGFHFHNDFPDWFQQDKLGHLAAGYLLSRFSSETFRWTGMDNQRSALYGALAGSVLLSSIEILDGFSEEWGASVSDVAANTLGSAMFAGQQILWRDQRISVKFSYSESGLARYRPNLLGSNLPERMLKDYNAQTYWFSFNLASFFPESNFLPPWLNIAIGHGASGMLGSRYNPDNNNNIDLPVFNRYREWYLAPDIDLTRLPVNNPWLKKILYTLNFFKIPAPTVEFNTNRGLEFHWLFF
ncbi:MAG TPA: DUF2279 domain-containing protein [Bacteroidales bacterium]|nr:DUF2279 domain-containing protein [Bacteroidales bacterium]